MLGFIKDVEVSEVEAIDYSHDSVVDSFLSVVVRVAFGAISDVCGASP